MKKGYWVVRANVYNQDEYSKYIEKASEIVAKNSGTFLVRGGHQTEYETHGYQRTVIVEFDSYKHALDCYNSEEYQPIKKIREDNSDGNVILIDGA